MSKPAQLNECSVVGCGLITLDLVVGHDARTKYVGAGGTCGNVLSILGYLGIPSAAVARLGSDSAGETVVTHLKIAGVNTDLVSLLDGVSTPRVAEILNGNGKHHFLFKCPQCGARLPRFRPPDDETLHSLADTASGASVFFFDRASKSIVAAAKRFKAAGALIYFEPGVASNTRWVREAVQAADIVKYSRHRIHSDPEEWLPASVFTDSVIIETNGASGLRYWIDGMCYSKEAVTASEIIDTAGAGDWCSAGIIRQLLGAEHNVRLSDAVVSTAIQKGQQLAADSVSYVGALGFMNLSSRAELLDLRPPPIACSLCQLIPRSND